MVGVKDSWEEYARERIRVLEEALFVASVLARKRNKTGTMYCGYCQTIAPGHAETCDPFAALAQPLTESEVRSGEADNV